MSSLVLSLRIDPKTHKNMVRHLISSLIICALLSSCLVSKKKYDFEVAAKLEAQAENKQLKSTVATLKKNISDLEAQKALLERQLAATKTSKDSLQRATSQNISGLSTQMNDLNKRLNEKEKLLSEKEQAIADREKTIQQLQDLLSKQQKAIEDLRKKITDALVAFNKDELSVEIRDGKVYVSLSEQLLFKSGSTAVDIKGQAALKKLAEVLNQNPEINVQIEGHTDNVPIKSPTIKDNWDLSVLRATSIIRILTESKLDNTRILASGRGEFYPISTNDSAPNKARNRRTEIILSPQLNELFQILNEQKF
ncbi:MAG: hypothetical protein EAZ57_07355 [Cytophagales bacterium]|nr:MAG: hypothetical protein EAZ57_07355 [Cytophagales bacterium]